VLQLSIAGGVDVHGSWGLVGDCNATRRRQYGAETLLAG
jgi:hypothetical protein